EKTAEILIETADSLGDGTVADAMRFRAAYILLDRVGDAGRAVDVVTPMLERHPDFVAAQDLVRSAHRQLGGTAILDTSLTAGTTEVDVRRDFGDSFAQLIREAEVHEYRVGDPAHAVDLYRQALEMRPGDPVARQGFDRAARAAGKVAELADLALRELKAIDPEDSSAKAEAYEHLARIDSELRGDHDSAAFSFRAAVDVEPTFYPALRALEKRYGARGEWGELFAIYGRMVAMLGDGPDTAVLCAERARVARLSGQAGSIINSDLRRAHELAPQLRRPLYHLYCQALREGSSLELAELEVAIAEYFGDDLRDRAAYYTRAGDTFQDLGSIEAAIDHYRSALEAKEDWMPALIGWRRAAVTAELWGDMATTALRQAAAEDDSELEERARLLHIAGVALMDKALEGERAIGVLQQVLELVPTHDDAFARLRILLDEEARHEELIALIERRIEVVDDKDIRLELHHSVSKLYRNLFEDREQAAEHLRSMLDIDPDHLSAIGDLSDLAWEQGQWADAAETLIQRARLETNERVLRNIFFRLGMVYADYLPDPKIAIRSFERVLSYDENDLEALARLADLYADGEDWKKALGACERLIKRETNPSRKIDHLHRAARIYVEGFDDAAKAEQAMKIALDVDPTSATALAAVVEFYEGVGDNRGLRVNLDRVAAAMRSRLYSNVLDPKAYSILSDIFERRDRIGVSGSRATGICAAEIAKLLGAKSEAIDELAAEAVRARPKVNKLAGRELDDYLYPHSVSAALRGLYGLLSDRIANKAVGIDLRRYGVGRGDRLSPSDPIVITLQEVAKELKVGEIEVYVSKEIPTMAVAEPTSPVSLILGEKLLAPDKTQQMRFLAGRTLKLCADGLAVPARMTDRDFGMLTAALVRQFQPDFVAQGLESSAIAELAGKHRKLIPGKLKDEAANQAVGLAGSPFDYKTVWAAIADAANRAGLMASGSASASVATLMLMGGYPDIQSAARDVSIVHLLRFAVSEEYTVMQAAISA
ncbi:MAG: tetratricopeptide repeat protein, partial [Deltaproteobacteria bacterium]|nr:tetratricopeptide repeat protein [Deltaproteobacteria bacterium]